MPGPAWFDGTEEGVHKWLSEVVHTQYPPRGGGGCMVSAEVVEDTLGWRKQDGVYWLGKSLIDAIANETVYEHWWNVKPNGDIFDGTAGQFSPSGDIIKTVPRNSPEHEHYTTWDDTGFLDADQLEQLQDIVQWSYPKFASASRRPIYRGVVIQNDEALFEKIRRGRATGLDVIDSSDQISETLGPWWQRDFDYAQFFASLYEKSQFDWSVGVIFEGLSEEWENEDNDGWLLREGAEVELVAVWVNTNRMNPQWQRLSLPAGQRHTAAMTSSGLKYGPPWFHLSNSDTLPTSGWVHIGVESASRARADRPYLHEVEFIGRAFNTPEDYMPDHLANWVTGTEDDAWSDIMYDLQCWHDDGGPEPGAYVAAAKAAASQGLAIYYNNSSEADEAGEPSISMVVQASSLRLVSTIDPRVGAKTGAYYHGTSVDLPVGTVLVPGDEIGKDNWGMENGYAVWLHDNPEWAGKYGDHVYEVEPIGSVENYSEGAGHTEEMDSPQEWEYLAPSARIVRKVAASTTFEFDAGFVLDGDTYAAITAYEGGTKVGSLTWIVPEAGEDTEISFIWVKPTHRRQGLATRMLAEARKAVTYRIGLSTDFTDMGRAWSKTVAAKPRRRMRAEEPEWRDPGPWAGSPDQLAEAKEVYDYFARVAGTKGGRCFEMSEWAEGRFSAKRVEGLLLLPAEQDMVIHFWNLLPNGDILDTTRPFDGHGEGMVVRRGSPEAMRYISYRDAKGRYDDDEGATLPSAAQLTAVGIDPERVTLHGTPIKVGSKTVAASRPRIDPQEAAEALRSLPPALREQFQHLMDQDARERSFGQGGRWYHASPASLPPGTILRPGGGPATDPEFYESMGDDGRANHVWITPDRNDASFWASMVGGDNIYEVEPTNPRPWGITGVDGYVCDEARIIERISTTGAKVAGYYGTWMEPYYIRFGLIPRNERSINHITGEREDGVSVYRMDTTGMPIDPDPEWFMEGHSGQDSREHIEDRILEVRRTDSPAFVVKGTERTTTGHDGEPLLRDIEVLAEWDPREPLAWRDTDWDAEWDEWGRPTTHFGSTKIYYHGTNADLPVGTRLLIEGPTGMSQYGSQPGVWFTSDLETAKLFGPRVYVVDPEGEVKNLGNPITFYAEGATVVSEVATAKTAYADFPIDEGKIDSSHGDYSPDDPDFEMPRTRGDWGFYGREKMMFRAGMPRGQQFPTARDISRYVKPLLPGIDVQVIVVKAAGGLADSVLSRDKTKARLRFTSDMTWEWVVLHEVAHIRHRLAKGRSGASHGFDYAGEWADIMYQQLGWRFDLGFPVAAAFQGRTPPTTEEGWDAYFEMARWAGRAYSSLIDWDIAPGSREGLWVIRVPEELRTKDTGFIAGYLQVEEKSFTPTPADEGYPDTEVRIKMLHVNPAMRGRGVGTKLLWQAFSLAGTYGWVNPGTFTPEGAALWSKVTGEQVRANDTTTGEINWRQFYGSKASAISTWQQATYMVDVNNGDVIVPGGKLLSGPSQSKNYCSTVTNAFAVFTGTQDSVWGTVQGGPHLANHIDGQVIDWTMNQFVSSPVPWVGTVEEWTKRLGATEVEVFTESLGMDPYYDHGEMDPGLPPEARAAVLADARSLGNGWSTYTGTKVGARPAVADPEWQERLEMSDWKGSRGRVLTERTWHDGDLRWEYRLHEDYGEIRIFDGRPRHPASMYATDEEWYAGGGDQCAYLGWRYDDTGAIITIVDVHPDHQRQGLATKMLEYARANMGVPIYHSNTRNRDGRAWSRRVGLCRTAGPINSQKSPGDRGYHHSIVGKNGRTYYIASGNYYDTIVAFTEEPFERVGQLTSWNWNGRREIYKVQVDERHRRQGIASAMLELAREGYPDLVHAQPVALSEDGKAWSRVVGGRRGSPPPMAFELASRRDGDCTRWTLGAVLAEEPSSKIGSLEWVLHDGASVAKITWVGVKDRYHRQGVASAMLAHAREQMDFSIEHGDLVSPAGKAWSEKVGASLKPDGTFRLYHGTHHDLPEGTILVPSASGPVPGNWGYGEGNTKNQSVWMTDEPVRAKVWAEDGAWAYARDVQGLDRDDAWRYKDAVYVYEVEPIGSVVEHPEGVWTDYAAPKARIVRRLGPDLRVSTKKPSLMDRFRKVFTRTAATEPEVAYRGVNVLILGANKNRAFLGAIARGNHRAAADILIETMAEGSGTDPWSGSRNGPRDGAGGWWITSQDDARTYAHYVDVDPDRAIGLMVPVVMRAQISEEGTHQHYDGTIFWKLEEGTPLTIDQFEVSVPTRANAQVLLDLLDTQGQWNDIEGWQEPTTFVYGEVTDAERIVLPIPPMRTQANLRSEAASGLWWHASPVEMPVGTVLVPSGPQGPESRTERVTPGREDDKNWVWMADTSAAYHYALKLSIRGNEPHLYLVRPLDGIEWRSFDWEDVPVTKRAEVVAELPLRWEEDIRTNNDPYEIDGKTTWGGKARMERWKRAFEQGRTVEAAWTGEDAVDRHKSSGDVLPTEWGTFDFDFMLHRANKALADHYGVPKPDLQITTSTYMPLNGNRCLGQYDPLRKRIYLSPTHDDSMMVLAHEFTHHLDNIRGIDDWVVNDWSDEPRKHSDAFYRRSADTERVLRAMLPDLVPDGYEMPRAAALGSDPTMDPSFGNLRDTRSIDGITYTFSTKDGGAFGTGAFVQARQGNKPVGHINIGWQGWSPQGFIIQWVEVSEDHRRQGIASNMLALAREHLAPYGGVRHDTALSPSGRPWSERVGTKATAQREGDERAFGRFTMRYMTSDLGERKPRHIITTYDGSTKVGELNWYGTTGTIHHIDVDDGYLRQGIATAMWEWSQEMRPKAKHSGDRTTQGDAWARSVGGPLPRRNMASRTAAFGDSPEDQKALEDLARILTEPVPGRSTDILPPAHVLYGGFIQEGSDRRLYVDGKPLTTLYRVVDPAEWAEARRNGYLQSRGGYTRASAQPDERWRRQGPSNIPGLTLEIDYDPADGWHASAEGYAATRSRIPLSRVHDRGSMTAAGAARMIP
jgi:ribosomal protein S18 acetylase RimI-like enzyme